MIYAENILICIALPLCVCVFFTKGSSKMFIMFFVCGMVTCLFSGYIVGYIQAVSGWEKEDIPIFLSPMIEEIIKMIPVLFVLFAFSDRSDIRAGLSTTEQSIPQNDETESHNISDHSMILIALGVSAGFATFENACYILDQGASSFFYILIRGLAVGVMHIVSVLAMTMLILALRRLKIISVPVIAGALTMSMTFHGLYNLLVSDPSILMYVGFSLPIVSAVVLMIPYQKFFSRS